MTDKVEKTAEEVLADVVKSEVAVVAETKADKSDLEGFAKSADIPSVEGLVKSEELEELKAAVVALTEKNETLEATVKSAPSIIKGDTMSDFEFSYEKGGDIDLSGEFHKSYDVQANVAGAPTGAAAVYHAMVQMNPWRGVSTVMPSTATAVNLPQVSDITAAAENTVPAAPTYNGDVTSATVVAQNWVSRARFSDASIADLPTLGQMVGSMIGQQIARREAIDMATQLAGANFTAVNTGVAAALPTTIAPYADMMASLSSAYKPNAKWMMSREGLAHLRSLGQNGTGSDLVINPSNGNFMLWGYEIVVNDYVAPGTVAGQHSAYFGDFRQGTFIMSRKELTISRHPDTLPGADTFYGNMRSRGTAWDENALIVLNTAA